MRSSVLKMGTEWKSIDCIERQIVWAEAEIARYEQKYQQTFAEWTESLRGQATLAQEDDWLEWGATRDMLDSWRHIKAEIDQSDV